MLNKMGSSKEENCCILFLFLTILGIIEGKRFQYEYVTCGTVLKLLNTRNSVRLHSHDVKYGSGSGQQSVTGVESSDDHNSYWQIRGKQDEECTRGEPIRCSQTVRFMHVSTGRNLHSHHFSSPLSHNLEVSAFGEGGEGDSGDHWTIVCNGKHWRRDDRVRLRHVATDHFLHVTGDSYGRPIHGQREISGYPSMSESNYWQAAEGIYIKPTESTLQHDEL